MITASKTRRQEWESPKSKLIGFSRMVTFLVEDKIKEKLHEKEKKKGGGSKDRQLRVRRGKLPTLNIKERFTHCSGRVTQSAEKTH